MNDLNNYIEVVINKIKYELNSIDWSGGMKKLI